MDSLEFPIIVLLEEKKKEKEERTDYFVQPSNATSQRRQDKREVVLSISSRLGSRLVTVLYLEFE